jgi:hypothetical protein
MRTKEAIEQVGVSPKTQAAAAAALVGPLVARLIGDLLDIEIDSEVVEGLVLAVIAAGSAGLAAWRAKPGTVKVRESVAEQAATPAKRGAKR